MNERAALEKPLTYAFSPDGPLDLRSYEQHGGYLGLREALKKSPEQLCTLVTDSALRGRGGAGFPTGLKWSIVPHGADARHPTYFVVNADEMEPGTFKDRILMERNPHQLIEGAIIGSYAVGADIAFIFLRWEYGRCAEILHRALGEAHDSGYLGGNILGSGYSLQLHLHVSAGRYMCGEETGMLDALEGRRASPRNKPPFPQAVGLFGRPTAINNVETISTIPHIVKNGAEWFKGLGKTADAGTKLYGVSGNVKNPGLWEMPMGTTAREILELAGGMAEGYSLRGFQPGGTSTDFLTHEHLDIPLDFSSVQKAGSRLGTGTMIILDDKTCPVGMVNNIEIFFSRESCGWCTPCRDGIPWAQKILAALEQGLGSPQDIDLLEHICFMIAPGRTFCAFAPGAAEPLQSAVRLFRDDFLAHVKNKGCPFAARSAG